MKELCRLCMSSELLIDITKIYGAKSFIKKILSCINIRVYPGHDLPLVICKPCEKKINKFYIFKQKCLKVDIKLRKLIYSSKTAIDANNGYKTTDTDLDNDFNQPSHNNNNRLGENSKLAEESSSNCQTSVEKSVSNTLVNTKQKHSRENKPALINRFQCELCGRVFKMKTGLENHLLMHSGLKPYPCTLCPKRFCRTENVIIHMRSHLGVKPFVCEICGRSSTKRQDLIRHMKIHSDVRNYACPQCGRQFKRSSDVTSHMRTHTGVRPYSCSDCKKNYTSHSGLRKHLKAHCKKICISDK